MIFPHPSRPPIRPVGASPGSSTPCARRITRPNRENTTFSPIHNHYYCYLFFD